MDASDIIYAIWPLTMRVGTCPKWSKVQCNHRSRVPKHPIINDNMLSGQLKDGLGRSIIYTSATG